MNKIYALLLPVICLITLECRKPEEIDKLAMYLKEEKRLRDKIPDERVLADSLTKMQEKFSVDMEKEFLRLHKNTKEWPVLLRKLRGG